MPKFQGLTTANVYVSLVFCVQGKLAKLGSLSFVTLFFFQDPYFGGWEGVVEVGNMLFNRKGDVASTACLSQSPFAVTCHFQLHCIGQKSFVALTLALCASANTRNMDKPTVPASPHSATPRRMTSL